MKTQTALIQRRNDILGKGFHYNICENSGGIISVGIRKTNRYRLALRETKEEKDKLLTSILSTPLSYDLRNFVLLKRLYHNFDEDISFKDFYEGTENGLKHNFKGNGLDSRINISTQDPNSYDFEGIGWFGQCFPYKKISRLSQEITWLHNKKKGIIQPIDKINQSVEEKPDSRNGFNEHLKDFKVGLRNTMVLSKLTKKIKQTEKDLNEYFNFINQIRGIHITAESRMENAYEIIADFYKQLLNPTREEEDFDVVEARKEIEEGWGEVKKLSKARQN